MNINFSKVFIFLIISSTSYANYLFAQEYFNFDSVKHHLNIKKQTLNNPILGIRKINYNGIDFYVNSLEPDFLFFSKKNLFSQKERLLYYKLKDKKYTGPFKLKISNIFTNEAFPFFDEKEQVLYYSSDRTGGIGNYDIYFVKYNNESETWGKPNNIGSSINTKNNDLLFVSSKRNFILLSSSALSDRNISAKVFSKKNYDANYSLINNTNIVDVNTKTVEQLINSSKILINQSMILNYKNLTNSHQSDDFNKRFKNDLVEINNLIYTYKQFDSCKTKKYILKNQLKLVDNQDKRGQLFSQIKRTEEKEQVYKEQLTSLNAQLIKNLQLKITPISNVKYEIPDFLFKIYDKTPYFTDNPYEEHQIPEKGIVYKIQLGAYSNDVDYDFYKGLSPIYKEIINDGKIKKYYVGYFYRYEQVNSALKTVQDYGYKSAFIIAFLDGKKLTTEKVREIELSR